MKAKVKVALDYITLPFRYLIGLIILLCIMPGIIRDLKEEEKMLERHIR